MTNPLFPADSDAADSGANYFGANSSGADSPTENFAANPLADGSTPATTAVRRLRPRLGTILWGILLLAFAAYMVIVTLLPVPPDPTLWLLGGVIVVGLGLVVAGIAAAARRAD
ncbi:hypothetical protein [Cryobacterium sp. PH29-G1]|uniref:hypothetical protein n=1 Tax=Cryobacterium sp. PH29-G1 TaxID=3046211 RepID=UPI0024BA9534|nr:hypothetical protein [Cryobacterium sp. PH29-G1]MDJ0350903.1 hypothetical protein [Cryobacterium sp. PH29-G1]